ncbi:uncharacterized protein LOC107693256 [Sinocyclocheilus anshuiensis]|uniref:uncharacterized protein LOC107693256 n=1 Tax=Sinocyclocheilus anshuiensis TaxID=1608454 RepID=UPI0007B83932|nr:PREDICTED: uncharacterized protein LOC107693256 [Sinocyclocheilus anshuiensis]
MYAVVTLQNSEEVMVVASNWLSIDKKQCYWPPFKSTEKCKEAVQNRDEPAIGWEKLNISFHGEHATFDQAEEHQKQVKEQYRSIYLFSINISTEFPGTAKRQKLEYSQGLSINQFHLPSMPITSRMSADGKDELLQMLRDIKSTVQENSAMLKKLLKENTVSEVPSSTSRPSKDVKTNPKLPVRTFDDVSRIERELNNTKTRQKYVKYLSGRGGFGQKDVIKYIMQHVIIDDLAKEFNWQGRGDKRPFSKLILADVIRDAALKHKINRVDCETEIKKYLQKMSYKADRLGRKRPREYEGSQNEILNVTSHTALDSTIQSVIESQPFFV